MTGEGLPPLVDLVDRCIIRILDLVFIRKELNGSVSGVAVAEVAANWSRVAGFPSRRFLPPWTRPLSTPEYEH